MKIELQVKFAHRIYGTPDGNYSVFSAEPANLKDRNKVKINRRYGTFTIAGDYAIEDDEIGSVFTVTIEEDYASRYPNSYKMIKLHYELPSDAEAQWDYLRNSNIVPLGTYHAIENVFDENVKILDVMMDTPEEMTKVRGIGEKRAEVLQRKLLENRDKATIFAEYGNIEGVGTKTINTLVNWKPSIAQTIRLVKEDPFNLLEIDGFGFMLADKFRAHYKLPLNDENRILHGTAYYLIEKFQETGNTYENIFEAAKFTSSKLLVSYEETIHLLAKIQNDEKALAKYGLKIFGKNITTKVLFEAELFVYNKTKDLIQEKQSIRSKDIWAKNKKEILSEIIQTLSDEQDQFLDLINEERVVVLLGPGGSGKSWAINLACQMIKKAGRTYGLYAPTARAAHVMGEYVDRQAYTIHRGLLPIVMMNETVTEDVIIVDEFSMVDSELAATVLKAMGPYTRLIIVGDDFQLQSVGPGNILFDLVEYLDVPTVRLTKIFRQDEGSGILDYANDLRMNEFRLPLTTKVDKGDIVFISELNNQKQQEIALKLYEKAYDKYGVEDIMLLTPTNKGPSGRGVLNKRVQTIVNDNPTSLDVSFGANQDDQDRKTFYRSQDYITVKANNYNMVTDDDDITEIINGDLGYVKYTTGKELTFEVNDHYFTIDKSEIHELIDHAWAITIHKSQGGQASEVIIVLPSNSYFMLNANMLYTAITRAKIKCYIIGDFAGINESAGKQANLTRKTMIQLKQLAEDKELEKIELKLNKTS